MLAASALGAFVASEAAGADDVLGVALDASVFGAGADVGAAAGEEQAAATIVSAAAAATQKPRK